MYIPFGERRFGRFSISAELLQDAPDAVMKVLGTTIVLRAEFMAVSNAIAYEAWCDQFGMIAAYDEPPSYDVELDDEGNVTWTMGS